MLYLLLADITLVVHVSWIIFLIFGSCWGRTHKLIMTVHLGGILFALLSLVFDWDCPFTSLEVWLRSKENTADAYSGSCIAHYVGKFTSIGIAPAVIFAIILLIALVNLWIYRHALTS